MEGGTTESGLSMIDHEAANLDALSQGSIWRDVGEIEGRMGREAGRAIHLRIVLLEDQSLVARHLREIGPAVARRMLHQEDLARAVGIADVGSDQIRRRDRSRIAERKQRIEDPLADGTPDVDDGETRDRRTQRTILGVDGEAPLPEASPWSICTRPPIAALMMRALAIMLSKA